jgi:hypothetical protein
VVGTVSLIILDISYFASITSRLLKNKSLIDENREL